jgi:signal transduction histidine kinase
VICTAVIGQDLSSLKVGLDTLLDHHPEAPEEIANKIAKLSGRLQAAIQAVRNLVYNLGPAIRDRLGLIQALREQREKVAARHGVQVDFLTAGREELYSC